MVGCRTLPAIGRAADARQTTGDAQILMLRPLRPRAIITGGNGGIGLIAQALAAAAATSRSGAATQEDKHAAATMAACPARSIPGSATSAIPLRSRRRWPRPRHSAGSTAALPMPASAAAGGSLHRPHRGAMADHVRDQSRRRLPRVPGRRPPHDRSRRCGRSLRPAGRDLEPASLFGTARNEHYAATKAAINALVRALAVDSRATASPPTPSCPAGSRAR